MGDQPETQENKAIMEHTIRSMRIAELEHFAHTAKAPSRVHASLKWMANNLCITLPVSQIQPHKPAIRDVFGVQANQKPAAELCMLARLEKQFMAAYDRKDPDCLGILSQWIQASAGVRLKHLKLAYPCQLSGALLCC